MSKFLRLELCVSYWEARKVRGLLAVFFPFHNYACQLRADQYRAKIKRAESKRK